MIRHNLLTNPTAAQRYIDGVDLLKDPDRFPWSGNPGLAIYDFFVFWHLQAMMTLTPPDQGARNAAHTGPVFLPWHRYMLLMLEFYLREALDEDEFRIPYWDWSADANLMDPADSPVWDDVLLGRFTGGTWRVRILRNPFSGQTQVTDRTLERELGAGSNGRLPLREEVRAALRDEAVYDQPSYDHLAGGFRNRLENLHNVVHLWVGGDMTRGTSPNDPVFYLHHANVDRIWMAWQQAHPASPYLPDQTAPEELLFHRAADEMFTYFDHGGALTPGGMLDVSQYYSYDTLSDLL